MTLDAQQRDDGSVYIRSSKGGGEGWSAEYDPDWGIKITAVGASRIPIVTCLLDRPDVYARQRKEAGIEESAPVPIPMILHCPGCHARHIDEGEFATRSHHSHACQLCGLVWRPAVVATVGVQFLPGFKNGAKS